MWHSWNSAVICTCFFVWVILICNDSSSRTVKWQNWEIFTFGFIRTNCAIAKSIWIHHLFLFIPKLVYFLVVHLGLMCEWILEFLRIICRGVIHFRVNDEEMKFWREWGEILSFMNCYACQVFLFSLSWIECVVPLAFVYLDSWIKNVLTLRKWYGNTKWCIELRRIQNSKFMVSRL